MNFFKGLFFKAREERASPSAPDLLGRIEEGVSIAIRRHPSYDLVTLTGDLSNTRRFDYWSYVYQHTRVDADLILDFRDASLNGTGAVAGIIYLMRRHGRRVGVVGPEQLRSAIEVTDLQHKIAYAPSLDALLASSHSAQGNSFLNSQQYG